jgi:hypothetical protein
VQASNLPSALSLFSACVAGRATYSFPSCSKIILTTLKSLHAPLSLSAEKDGLPAKSTITNAIINSVVAITNFFVIPALVVFGIRRDLRWIRDHLSTSIDSRNLSIVSSYYVQRQLHPEPVFLATECTQQLGD